MEADRITLTRVRDKYRPRLDIAETRDSYTCPSVQEVDL